MDKKSTQTSEITLHVRAMYPNPDLLRFMDPTEIGVIIIKGIPYIPGTLLTYLMDTKNMHWEITDVTEGDMTLKACPHVAARFLASHDDAVVDSKKASMSTVALNIMESEKRSSNYELWRVYEINPGFDAKKYRETLMTCQQDGTVTSVAIFGSTMTVSMDKPDNLYGNTKSDPSTTFKYDRFTNKDCGYLSARVIALRKARMQRTEQMRKHPYVKHGAGKKKKLSSNLHTTQ